MTKDNAKDFLPLVQALIEGKTIQVDVSVGGQCDWVDFDETDNIQFKDEPSKYRVKPEPREWWVLASPEGQLGIVETEEAARECLGKVWTEIIHVREVI